jgi:hypothetical protein
MRKDLFERGDELPICRGVKDGKHGNRDPEAIDMHSWAQMIRQALAQTLKP